MNRRLHSMKLQLALTLLFSGVLAVFIYVSLNTVLVNCLDTYYQREDVIVKEQANSVKSLQKFVLKNHVSSQDSEALEEWSRRNNMLYITVMGENTVLFDDISADEEFYKNQPYYTITFQDGENKVFLIGFYGNRLYITAMVISMFVAVLFFLLICIGFMERKISYITLLEREIKILKTGSLDKVITIKGSDELASLAEGLDEMRISLKENMAMKEKLRSANEGLVTSLSHDLRTPLTTLMLYLELIEKGKAPDTVKQKQYLNKCSEKAKQIKALSDRLFESVLVTRKESLDVESPQYVQYVLEDVISDMIMFLESQGFWTNCSIEWRPVKISVSTEYMIRIVNNISSNIIKYADSEKSIKIEINYTENMVEVGVSNVIAPCRDQVESTKLGVDNIHSMMNKMNGTCEANVFDGCYTIKIRFPIA